MSEISKKIIIDELIEDSHPAPVEDVIFYALQKYAKQNKETWGGAIAYAVSKRMEDAENEKNPIIQNEPIVSEFLK